MRARTLRLLGGGIGVAAAGLLLAHTSLRRADTDFGEMLAFRRLWSDWALGVSYFIDAGRPVSAAKEASRPWPEWSETIQTYRDTLLTKVGQDDLSPARFWRTMKLEPFARNRGRPHPHDADDPGRGILLGWGFRLLGGPAPFLILWVGAIVAVPVLLWTAMELTSVWRPSTAIVFLGLIACSPFVVEILSLPRAAVGFYLVALLLVVPVATYAALAPRPDSKGLLLRAAGAGLLFALCALCRSSALFLLPGFVAALTLAAARFAPRPGRVRHVLAVAALALAVFLLPYAVIRPPQHHDIWPAVWEGLGDFDRTKGHSWSDPAADEVVRGAGGDTFKSPAGEAILREIVLREVREDPMWFAGILVRRFAATVTQSKLWPHASTDGLWMTRGRTFNEGFLDKYYTYTTTADFLAWGSRRIEMPIALVIGPTVMLAVLALGRWPRASTIAERALAGTGEWARPGLLVMGCVALAALPLPVLLTTAGAAEPQGFVVVYLLGAALAAEAIGRVVVLALRSRQGRHPALATSIHG
jgi:hypothetical protein